MKKFSSLLLAVFLLCFSACGQAESPQLASREGIIKPDELAIIENLYLDSGKDAVAKTYGVNQGEVSELYDNTAWVLPQKRTIHEHEFFQMLCFSGFSDSDGLYSVRLAYPVTEDQTQDGKLVAAIYKDLLEAYDKPIESPVTGEHISLHLEDLETGSVSPYAALSAYWKLVGEKTEIRISYKPNKQIDLIYQFCLFEY